MSQVSLHGKFKYDAEYKASADKVYDFWSSNLKDIPKAYSKVIHSVELVQGCWGKEGSIHVMKYTLDGKPGTCEEIIEAVDCKKKYMCFKVIGGSFLDYYRNVKFILDQVTPKSDGGSLACWTLEYEKLNENVPDPVLLHDAAVNLQKAISAYLSPA